MPQIFVFTAGNPEARQHLADSIQSPIDDPQAKVFDNFDEAYHAELEMYIGGKGKRSRGGHEGPDDQDNFREHALQRTRL